jgi:hypothetical protein
MKKFLLIMLSGLILGLISNVNAQLLGKTICYDKAHQIWRATSSINYVGVNVYNKISRDRFVILYDKQGNQLFRKDFTLDIGDIFITESFQAFIIQKIADDPEAPNSFDDIVAYDLTTGQERWTTQSNASRFDISPDKRYLMPVQPHSEKPFIIEIIDISDGSKLHLNLPSGQPNGVAWFDNDRIVLVYSRLQLNQEYLNSEQANLRKKINEITAQRKEIMQTARDGKMDKNIAKIRMEELLNERNALEIKENQLVNTTKSPNQYTMAPSTLVIFNIKTNSIELVKDLFDSSNDPFIIGREIASFPVTSVDKNNNIYLIGKIKINEHNYKDTLLKLDMDTNLLWTCKVERGSFYRLVYNGEIIFSNAYYDNGTTRYFIIDDDNGRTISLSEIENQTMLLKKFPNIDIKSKIISTPNREIFDNLDIDYDNATITFY